MIELEHSPLGGSAAYRFMNCDFSFLEHRRQLEAGEFVAVESEYAKLGTGAHELGAKAIATNCEPFEFLGQDFNGYKAGWPGGISLDAVQIYFSECMKILADRKAPGAMLLEETIHRPDIHPLLRGTVDFGFWSKLDGVFLRDYKNGEGIGVSAGGNNQLLYYGFLMLLKVAETYDAPRDMRVSLGIVQPNFYGIFEEPDIWETTAGFVIDWARDELLPKMNDLYSRQVQGPVPEEAANPGDWCQFCPVLIDCPKMQKAFLEYANAEEGFVAMLKDEDLNRYYEMREPARRFMKVLEQTVFARLVAGGAEIPSAKLVEKRVNRVWKPGAIAALKEAFGEKAFTVPEVKSPAQIEKLSSTGKDLAKEYGYKPITDALTIAPRSDPRPEATRKGNADIFAAHATSPAEAGF